MINEQSLHIKSSNCKAKVTFWVLIALSVINFVCYAVMNYFDIDKSGLVGIFTLAFITAAILIYTKYVSSEYYYDITHDSDGTAVFVVRQVVGKRASTLCRIALSDIARIERETRAKRKKHKTPYSTKKYNYTPTLIPELTYRITTRNRYESAEIIIEAPEVYADMLSSYVSEAKAIEAEREANSEW